MVALFNFDESVADSVGIKTEASSRLYEPHGDERAKEARYHLEHSDRSRHEEVAHDEREFLGHESTEQHLRQLGRRFSELVVEAVVAALEMLHASNDRQLRLPAPAGPGFGPTNEELGRYWQSRLGQILHLGRGSPTQKSASLPGTATNLDRDLSELLMVGDTMIDLWAAQEAGARSIGCCAEEDPSGRFRNGREPLPPPGGTRWHGVESVTS